MFRFALVVALGAALVVAVGPAGGQTTRTVPVTISGGFELHSNDYGRPVTLYASMLGVPPNVFRKAFSGVHPDSGHDPSTEDQQANKDALMSVLAPYGVTNDELDRVANYYRFNATKGETWPHRAAKAVATVRNGKIVAVRVTDPGVGYSYAPRVSVNGFRRALKARVVFTRQFRTNGHLRIVLK